MKKICLLFLVLVFTTGNTKAQKTFLFASGKSLTVTENSTEDFIISFLQNPASHLDTATVGSWFDLDETKFVLGKTILEKKSFKQLKNITTILDEFPKLKIKIGCYSDKLGNEEANIKLTQARANEYRKNLLSKGVFKSKIISAYGYGSTFAKYSATDTQENREKDRKIAIRIVTF